MFEITATQGKARTGVLSGKHRAETPFFMPVATKGAVRLLSSDDLSRIGVRTLISNAYLLSLRPGTDIIKKMGGLHSFMDFDGFIFTDSGGFQMLNPEFLIKNTEEGVWLRSPFDGSKQFISPEDVMQIEMDIGADVAMMLDDVQHYGTTKEQNAQAVRKTTAWAKRCMKAHHGKQLLFGITQGGVYKDLREKSTRQIVGLKPDGIALGGLCIGESQAQMQSMIRLSKKIIPARYPIYLMGVGSPHDLVECVGMGVDIFDSRFPTRNARHGTVFTRAGSIHLNKRMYADDEHPIDETCDCFVCKRYSRAYLRHLYQQQEGGGLRLLSYHNVHFITKLMREIRTSIAEGEFTKFRRLFLSQYKVAKERGKFAYSSTKNSQ